MLKGEQLAYIIEHENKYCILLKSTNLYAYYLLCKPCYYFDNIIIAFPTVFLDKNSKYVFYKNARDVTQLCPDVTCENWGMAVIEMIDNN